MALSVTDRTKANEDAARLTPDQQQVLRALDGRPGLILDIAVRLRKFPEDVQPVVDELAQQGLVRLDSVAGTPLGGNLFLLTPYGDQVAAALRDLAVVPPAEPLPAAAQQGAPEPSPTPANPLQQQYDVLVRLGELAEKSGDTAEAANYYKAALEVSKKLAGAP